MQFYRINVPIWKETSPLWTKCTVRFGKRFTNELKINDGFFCSPFIFADFISLCCIHLSDIFFWGLKKPYLKQRDHLSDNKYVSKTMDGMTSNFLISHIHRRNSENGPQSPTYVVNIQQIYNIGQEEMSALS